MVNQMDAGSRGSMFDEVEVRPIEVEPYEGNLKPVLVLSIITAIFLLSFFFWLTYALSKGIINNQTIPSSGRINQCAPGQCSVNFENGEKVCPETSGSVVAFQPKYQECTSPNYCDGTTMRYAILPDGDTDPFGICPNDPLSLTGELTKCRCSPLSRCSRNTLSVFQAITGNPYQSLSGTNTSFTQSSTKISQGSIDGPSISSASNTFCRIPLAWLLRSNPGCSTIPTTIDPISTSKNCVASNPCLYGTIAYIVDNPDTFSLEDLNRIPLGCVAGSPCPDIGESFYNVPIFDTNYGEVICKSLEIPS